MTRPCSSMTTSIRPRSRVWVAICGWHAGHVLFHDDRCRHSRIVDAPDASQRAAEPGRGAPRVRQVWPVRGRRQGGDAQIEETAREHAQIRRPVDHQRIVQQGEQFAELGFCGGVVLPVERCFGRGIQSGRDFRQKPLSHFAECRAYARRCVGLGGHEQRIDRDHGGDGALGFVSPAQREQAEQSVLLDRFAIHGLAAHRQPVQDGERFVVSRRRVEVPGVRQRATLLCIRRTAEAGRNAQTRQDTELHVDLPAL